MTEYRLLCFLLLFSCSRSEEEVSLVTKKGSITGLKFSPSPATGVSYDAFLGIPYGQIPHRFQLAEPRDSWDKPLKTQKDGPVCPQPGVSYSEDCLYMNVFTPPGASQNPGELPVMVYIHGARFTRSSSSSVNYGPDFLVNASVILVTMNYRLGAAGFLTLGSKEAPGNLGLHDALLALQWVQDEISTFGGDPTQVTLFGQSSGGVMVQMIYLSALSEGLFKRVIAQSGSALTDWGNVTPEEGARRARLLAEAVGCGGTRDQDDATLLSCLQSADIKHIIDKQAINLSVEKITSGQFLRFVPVLDTPETADRPFFKESFDTLVKNAQVRRIPMITGFTAEDGIIKFGENVWKLAENDLGAFIPRRLHSNLTDEEIVNWVLKIKNRYFKGFPEKNVIQSVIDLYTDTMFAYPAVQMARHFSDITYGFLFAYDGSWAPTAEYFKKYKMKGVNHKDDVRYLFFDSKKSQDLSTSSSNVDNVATMNNMVRWWTDFAKTGVPDPSWPTVAKGGYLIIDDPRTMTMMNTTAFEDRYYNFWASD